MSTKLVHILCIYFAIAHVKASNMSCKTNNPNNLWCNFTTTEHFNDKPILISFEVFLMKKIVGIKSSALINSVNSVCEGVGLLKPDEVKYINCVRNLTTNKKKNCEKNFEEFIINKFKRSREMHISEIHFMDDTTFDFYAQFFTNVTHLYWSYLETCEPASKLSCKFKKLKYASIYYRISEYKNCKNVNFKCTTQIKEIRLKMQDLSVNKTDSKRLSETILTGMENLKIFTGSCSNKWEKFPITMFNQLENLSELTFINCGSVNIETESTKNLTNLKTLIFQNIDHVDESVFSSEALRNNLEYLELHVINMLTPISEDVLQYYKKLKFIYIIHEGFQLDFTGYFENVSAFICNKWSNKCGFEVDIYKRPCPNGCKCSLHYNERIFEVSCDRFESLTYVPIPITGNASLNLDSTSLTTLPNATLYGYSNLREMHLANNNLSELSVDQLPPYLTYLDLSNNNLSSLNRDVLKYLSNKSGLIRIRLSGNPWNCSCDYQDMVMFVANFSHLIEDREMVKCKEKKFKIMVSLIEVDLCGVPENYALTISLYLLGIALSIILVLLILLFFKVRITLWLYEHNLCLCWISQPESEQEKVQKMDAFLAFCHKDLNLVDEYVDKLENGPCKYKLCFYQRDWLIGVSIAMCIMKTIENSKRIIILMTEHFVNSSWGQFEFRQAIRATSIDPTKRLIVIVYPEVKNFEKLDTELRLYMKFNTYLEREDPLFWRKLLYAMPHRSGEADLEDVPAV